MEEASNSAAANTYRDLFRASSEIKFLLYYGTFTILSTLLQLVSKSMELLSPMVFLDLSQLDNPTRLGARALTGNYGYGLVYTL